MGPGESPVPLRDASNAKALFKWESLAARSLSYNTEILYKDTSVVSLPPWPSLLECAPDSVQRGGVPSPAVLQCQSLV